LKIHTTYSGKFEWNDIEVEISEISISWLTRI